MPNPATPSRLVTKKLTAAAPTSSTSGGWLRATPPASLSSSPAPGDAPTAQPPPSVKPLGLADALKRPTLVSSTSALSTDSRPSAVTSRDQSPVKAWASVSVPTGDLGRNLQDFPTAAEAAADHSEVQGAKRPGASAVQEEHGAENLLHTEEGDARDSFRGIHLDPKAHHWDEMEDESNDFLGDVIDFGDGKTYTVPPEEEDNVTGTVSKESRFGDDYDRSWPRTRPTVPENDGAGVSKPASQHSRHPPAHGLPPRQASGDGRVLFNERSNRLEPAREHTSAHVLPPASSSHFHGPPHAHVPRNPGRRNSALSASERPRSGTLRDLPPHARDPPPHVAPGASSESRARRPSDARSTHSPVERRSSFLHDEERPRMGSTSWGRTGDEPGSAFHGMRRETSRDSRISTGERQPWGIALQRTTSQRTAGDSSHTLELAAASGTAGSHSDQVAPSLPSDNTTKRSLLSPSLHTTTLPTISSPQPSPTTVSTAPNELPETSVPPVPPSALSDERDKFMKQAAERARRRRLEEEAAREEARERARKKAAELEALSKASLVSASPLVALTRKSSATGLSSGAKSPVPKSPSVSPAALPVASAVSETLVNKPKEIPESSSAVAQSSWRAKPKAEPPVVAAASESPQATVVAQHDSVQRPPAVTLGHNEGIGPIEELGQADEPMEVLDFSDMSKLAGRRTSVTSNSDFPRTKRSPSEDFLDEAPSSRRSSHVQPPFTHWNRDTRNERPVGDHPEDRIRAPPMTFNRQPQTQNRLSQDGAGAKPPMPTSNQSSLPPRSSLKEAQISALDDVMSRIKGVLTGMHADNEKPAAGASQPHTSGLSSVAPTSATPATAHAPVRPNLGAATRWKGDGGTNWRDGSNKRPPNGPLPEAKPTEPFATTRPERPDTPPPAWHVYTVRLNKNSVARPPMSKKQATLAKLPPMPVRWDILTWDPPVERMSTRTLSRDDTFFPKITIRGKLSAVVNLPSTSSSSEAQPAKQNKPPTQQTRLTLVAGPDPKPTRSPNVLPRVLPKGPAFSEAQWRKPQATSPLRNTLELHNHVSPTPVDTAEENQLETTSRSPPPHHATLSQMTDSNVTSVAASSSSKAASKQPRGTDVAFRSSLKETRPPTMPSVSFTVSSELDDLSVSDTRENAPALAQDSEASMKLEGVTLSVIDRETAGSEASENLNGDAEQVAAGDISGDKTTQSPTPNSSVLLTPPAKATPPWQSSNQRLSDADFIKSVWQHTPPKDGGTTENSLRGLTDDFPSSIPHSVQEMKADEETKPIREPPTANLPVRAPHNAHRGFQHVPTSPIPMYMPNYMGTNHLAPQAGPSRPMPSFSLPPPAPPQVTAQPSPYAPYVHPTPPTLIYPIPPSRIAPSPAPGGPMWMQNQGYGRPSPPAGMYPGQPGHNMQIKAKARIRAEAENKNAQTSKNANGKRPLGVTSGDSESPPKKTGNTKDPNAPLKRDTRLMGRYLDYDLSKMVNSKGGFLVEEKSNFDEETRRKEKERELQRLKQAFDPPIHIEKDKNPQCADCGSVDIDQQYRKSFHILDYLLTDPELRDEEVMPHLLKANPHKSTWNNMMLFVRFQVEEFAFKKWGGPEGLDEEWERRMAEKRSKRSKKFEDGLRDLRRKTRESGWAKRKAEEHVHTFGVVDKELSVQRCTECDFEVEVEEFSGF
ncbi:hypothetical protein FRC09_007744 [Ceratobasidium sp. 395]|nr:hypothetical protein FRC09_007744 [Ceratobasidium sp. 395]